MKTEHYPSRELCHKLKEIGFPETEQYYDSGGEYGICYTVCPSVMEMLDVIPHSLDRMNNYPITIEKYHSRYKVYYRYRTGWSKFIVGELPNALAEMILWLHENNHISFSK